MTFFLILKLTSSLLLRAGEIQLPSGLIAETKSIHISKEKAELGRLLFFDKKLSADKTISCASCHNPSTSFTINKQFANGVYGRLGSTNPPVIFNRYQNGIQFWDGRAGNLYDQARGPLFDQDEMGNTPEGVLDYLNSSKNYKTLFNKIFSKPPEINSAIEALVEYEKTFLAGSSRYDLYRNGQKNVLTEEEKKGMNLFFNKFQCINCHSGQNFTNENLEVRCYPKFFTNLSEVEKAGLKRIKVPTLRNIERSWPYLHDGSLRSLNDVIDFYSDTGVLDEKSGKITKEIKISHKEKKELIAFLKTLTDLKEPK